MNERQHHCPKCNNHIGSESPHEILGEYLRVITPHNNSTLVENPNQAPKLRCGQCGRTIILVEGSL